MRVGERISKKKSLCIVLAEIHLGTTSQEKLNETNSTTVLARLAETSFHH